MVRLARLMREANQDVDAWAKTGRLRFNLRRPVVRLVKFLFISLGSFWYSPDRRGTMFEVRVSSYAESINLIWAGWPTKIISVISEEIEIHGAHHLHVIFDDIARPMVGYIHPTEEHLAEIFEFSKDFTEDDHVLVHCHAGISRSAAIAIGICIQHGMTYQEAYDYIATVRPIMSPNKLIIQYIDKHFGIDGKLIDLVNENELYPNLFRLLAKEQEH